MTQQTVSSLAVFTLLGEEAPIDGNSSGVADDGLGHAPDQQKKEDVKNDE